MKIVFPLFSRLTGKIDIISSPSYVNYFPGWTRFILVGFQAGKFSKKAMFKIANTNLKKTCSFLLSVIISGPATPILCFRGSSTYVADSKTRKNLYYVFVTNNIKAKEYLNILNKQSTYRIIIKAYRMMTYFFAPACQKKLFHSAEKMHSPDRDLRELEARSQLGGETFTLYELNFFVVENQEYGKISLKLFSRPSGIIFLI